MVGTKIHRLYGKGEISMLLHTLTFFCLLASILSELLVVFLVFAILFIIVTHIYRKTLNYEMFADTATVINAERDDNVLFTPDYYVYVNYCGKEFCIEDEKLYAEAVVGNNIKVYVHKGFNGARKVRAMYLTAS